MILLRMMLLGRAGHDVVREGGRGHDVVMEWWVWGGVMMLLGASWQGPAC